MKSIKTKKGYCLLAVILVILAWFLSGLKIETVKEHNEKKSKESNERQSILAELQSKEVDSSEKNTTMEPEGTTVVGYESELESTDEAQSSEQIETTKELGTTDESASSREPETGMKETVAPVTEQKTVNHETTTKQPATESGKPKEPETTTKQESIIETETTTQKEESKYYIVNIKISCESVIGHKDLDTSADLPGDGIILNTQTVVKKGETVLDALEAACADNSISLVNEGSGYGAYISAIGGLAEGECGRYSGWKYKINGEITSISCSSYEPKENDEILWYYATDYK